MRYAFIVRFFGVMILAAVVLVGIAALALIHQHSIVADACTSSPTRQTDFERCGLSPPVNDLARPVSDQPGVPKNEESYVCMTPGCAPIHVLAGPALNTTSNNIALGYNALQSIPTDGRSNTLIGSIYTPAENGGTYLCKTPEGYLGETPEPNGAALCSPFGGP